MGGAIVSELIVKFFHGEFTPQGFKRYSGLWKGPPPGTIGRKDIAVGLAGLKEQFKGPMFVTKGGVGYGVDEMSKVADDGKGWVWLANEMSPGGLAVELFTSVPYGQRALLVATRANVDEMFDKVNWGLMDKRVDTTLGVLFMGYLGIILSNHSPMLGISDDTRKEDAGAGCLMAAFFYVLT